MWKGQKLEDVCGRGKNWRKLAEDSESHQKGKRSLNLTRSRVTETAEGTVWRSEWRGAQHDLVVRKELPGRS